MAHNLERKKTYQTGAELWCCPECDRQIVIQWQPHRHITLKAGNEKISHNALKGITELNFEVGEMLESQ